MALVRWDPIHEVRSLARRMEKAFEPLVTWDETWGRDPLMAMGTMWPAVDVYEDKEEITLRAELAGMERKDVELILEDSTLTLRGERKLEREEKKENYQRVECRYGSFSRSFAMPGTIDRDRISAEMKNGVLVVHVPKREGAKGKAINIAG